MGSERVPWEGGGVGRFVTFYFQTDLLSLVHKTAGI